VNLAATVLVEVILAVGRVARSPGAPLPDPAALRDALRPAPGLELVSARGDLHTGIVVVHDNAPVMTLTARRSPPSRLAPARAQPGPWPTDDDDFSSY
jgi:hypothetical protein